MKLPDWRNVNLDAGVLREATPDPGRIVLWLPGGCHGGVRLWERIGNLPGADVTAAQGLCATAATSVRAAQRAGGLLGKLLARWRRAAAGPTWVLPNGASAEQQGERQTDLVLAWPEDESASVTEEGLRRRWPHGKGFRRLGRHLFLVSGVQTSVMVGGPLPPQVCPKEQAQWLLTAARQAGDRRREALALNDLGIACTNASEAGRAVTLLQEALGLAGQVGDQALATDVRGNLGMALLWARQPGRGLELLEQALAQARAVGDRYAAKTVLDHQGTAFSALRRPAQALPAFAEALDLARALGDQRHEAELLWQLAVQYAELGQREKALAQGQAAVAVLEEKSHPHASWFADNLRKYRSGEAAGGLAQLAGLGGIQSGGEIVVGARAPRAQQASGPGLLRMAFSAAKSMAQFLMSGLKTVAAETQQRRLRMCATCEHHSGMRCRVCGCFTSAKAWLAHEQCPLGKWPV
jgi:tetratricopeptide (TPR) repeat protein